MKILRHILDTLSLCVLGLKLKNANVGLHVLPCVCFSSVNVGVCIIQRQIIYYYFCYIQCQSFASTMQLKTVCQALIKCHMFSQNNLLHYDWNIHIRLEISIFKWRLAEEKSYSDGDYANVDEISLNGDACGTKGVVKNNPSNYGNSKLRNNKTISKKSFVMIHDFKKVLATCCEE